MRYVAKMRTVAMCIFAVVLLLGPKSAHATEFNMNGASCTPGHDAVTNYLYQVLSGTIRHRGTETASITMLCPIPGYISSPSHLYLLYSNTENHADTYVKAYYYKMHKTTGVVSQVDMVTSANGVNNGSVTSVSHTFSDTYDGTTYVYYVKVLLKRRTGSETSVFYGVTVW